MPSKSRFIALYTVRTKRVRKLLLYATLIARNRFSRRRIVDSHGPVLSMTTHGKRLDTVYLALESIGRGSERPARCLLWLDDGEPRDAELPQTLRRLVRRGLEIGYTPSYGPHGKYYPYVATTALLREPLVIADDDIFYGRQWLAALTTAFRRDPGAVHCHRAHRIAFAHGKIAPYAAWKLADDATTTVLNFATGVGGTIFPPALLERLKAAGPAFRAVCPRADDIWLHAVALRAGFATHQIAPEPADLAVIPGSQSTSLLTTNIVENDRQIAATYTNADTAALRNAKS